MRKFIALPFQVIGVATFIAGFVIFAMCCLPLAIAKLILEGKKPL